MTGIIINAIDPNALAASSAFTGTYAPLTAIDTERFLPAHQFAVTSGSPVLGAGSSSEVSGMLLDAATTEAVATFARVPAGWATYNIELWWTNAGAGSGNVVWRLDYGPGFGDGESVTPSTSGSNTTIAAPTANTAKRSVMHSGISVPASGEILTIRPRRVGGDAADTLANDALLIGVKLVKAS